MPLKIILLRPFDAPVTQLRQNFTATLAGAADAAHGGDLVLEAAGDVHVLVARGGGDGDLLALAVGVVEALEDAALPHADRLDVVALLEVAPVAEVDLLHLADLERLAPADLGEAAAQPALGLVVRDGAEVGGHGGAGSLVSTSARDVFYVVVELLLDAPVRVLERHRLVLAAVRHDGDGIASLRNLVLSIRDTDQAPPSIRVVVAAEGASRLHKDGFGVVLVQEAERLLALLQLLAPPDEGPVPAVLIIVENGANSIGDLDLATPDGLVVVVVLGSSRRHRNARGQDPKDLHGRPNDRA